ncbi:MAG: translation initiation factor IF-2 [Ruminococcaceae bacterium]|nr:translation initiation factor IF-2 [Oscillospiraceae bacterium]
MAETKTQFKINKLAKDLGLKAKDLVELLGKMGHEVTAQKALEPLEFDLLFDALTKENQIADIGSYLDGATYIPSKLPKQEKKEEPQVEEKKPAQTKSEPETAAPVKNEAAKPADSKAPAKAEAPKAEQSKSAPAPKAEAPKADTQKAEAPKAEAPKTGASKAEQSKPAPKMEEFKPTPAPKSAPAPVRPAQQAPQTRPQNGFAAGSPRPGYGQGQSQRPTGVQGQRPANGMQSARPAPTGGFSQRPGSGFGSGIGATGYGIGNPNQRPPQKKQSQRRPGGDKDDHIPSGPKDTFKAKEIVRGASSAVNPDGTRKGPRVVDTRGSEDVNLSKYDERLDSFVSEREQNLRGGNQRLKKQNNQQNGAQPFGKGKPAHGKKGKGAPSAPTTVRPTAIELPDEIMVGQLASRLMVTAGEVVKKLMMMGMMVTVNQVIEYDYAALVAEEFGVTASHEVVVSIEEKLFDDAADAEENLVSRAPVVCVMGHVDHGKTSILDAIRHTQVTAGEAGGITQHIGAYRVKVKGREITFLDTPGHEAFTAMRARGAMATDIAILVVAADDGVMPQTVEAINHAKAAGIDIVVAINKMDKPGANPENIKQELTKYDLVPEEWGGDVICVPVSALTGQGIDDLLESVLLVADVKELKANPNRRAKGIVIEAKLDRGRGPVATVLVQNGTLHAGDIIIAGSAVGRVRSMTDHNGKSLKEAAPSVPVEITGLAEVPSSGDEFQAVEDERMARTLADQRRDKVKEDSFRANARASLNDLFDQISDGVKNLNIIVKADVGGSVEAVKQSLEKLSNEEVKVRVIHAAAGGITEGDVTFAAASNAIIVGFNVRPDKMALDSAERQNVEIRTYRVIYECIEEIEAAMKGMLAPKFRENLLGHAEVRQTIHVPNIGTIAGSYVQDGKITRQSQIRVVRDGVVIFEDKISSLRRFKDDVKEVASGYECGVGLEKFNDIKVGDVLEAFVMEEVKQ